MSVFDVVVRLVGVGLLAGGLWLLADLFLNRERVKRGRE